MHFACTSFNALTTTPLMPSITMPHACGIVIEGMSGVVVSALKEVHAKCIPYMPTEENPAKLLAYKLLDRLPVIVGGGVLAPVARRWKTQINENAKTACIHEQLPE